ncbi:hypothetical protein [Rossellomorea marisflavi]|uniref:hypothetical protein n=1 Tax=Rossellomorea marisflavi TaxID=189381 RepID=UPI00345C623D
MARIHRHELEKAVAEREAEGWELVTPIHHFKRTERIREDRADRIETVVFDKYTCVMRRESSPMKKSEARKRIAGINKSQRELIEELYAEVDRVIKENSQLNVRIHNLEKSREEKNKTIQEFKNKLRSITLNFNDTIKRNADLENKIKSLTEQVTTKTVRKAKQGMYPAVIKTGKRWMVIGEYKTPEEAEKHEKQALEAI